MSKRFLKSSRPSLPLKKAPPLISIFSPQARRRKPPSGAQNRYALRLADHQRSSPCFAGWDRLAVMGISLQLYCWKWVHGGGLQIETTIFVPHCSIALHLSPLEWGILFFILLLRGLLLERYPSGLWRKSYDRHWPYVPKWNKRAMPYLRKPSSTSCLILLATSNCSSRTIIWIYISLPQASMQIGKSTTFISNNPWSFWNKLVKSLLR